MTDALSRRLEETERMIENLELVREGYIEAVRSAYWYASSGGICPKCGVDATKAVNRCVSCGWRPISRAALEGMIGLAGSRAGVGR